MEIDNGNWCIDNRQNLHESLATCLLFLTGRGGGIGVNICNLDRFLRYLGPNDLYDGNGDILEHLI
jgi:hypothetical protein